MNKLELFTTAFIECQKMILKYPDFPPLLSVCNQLQYLIELAEGKRHDSQLLETINLGLIAAREIEAIDVELADLLHKVNAELDQLICR